MKKRWVVVLALCLCVALSTSVGAAKTVGWTRSTDIVAQIDGRTMRSFNVEGETVVVAEDLARYGFGVAWDGVRRELRVYRDTEKPMAPTYVPAPLQRPIGTPVHRIYDTDIVAYVAGQAVRSFNIGGETAIVFDDLSVFGEVKWQGDARILSLTLGDAYQLALDRLTDSIEDWRAFAGSSTRYEIVEGALGSVFLGHWTGTSHGASCQMALVLKSGTVVSLAASMPNSGFGAQYYLQPREVAFSQEGYELSFFTPVYDDGTALGDAHCRVVNVHLAEYGPVQIEVTPMEGALAHWDALLAPDAPWSAGGQGMGMRLTLQREYEQVVVRGEGLRLEGVVMSASEQGIVLIHPAALFWTPAFSESPYGQAYQALEAMELPRVTQEEFSPVNSAQQRRQAEQWFRVTRDGRPVAGDLWWSHGNNHTDLTFTFEQRQPLLDGESLVVEIGPRI